jgi:hypothetical protein
MTLHICELGKFGTRSRGGGGRSVCVTRRLSKCVSMLCGVTLGLLKDFELSMVSMDKVIDTFYVCEPFFEWNDLIGLLVMVAKHKFRHHALFNMMVELVLVLVEE